MLSAGCCEHPPGAGAAPSPLTLTRRRPGKTQFRNQLNRAKRMEGGPLKGPMPAKSHAARSGVHEADGCCRLVYSTGICQCNPGWPCRIRPPPLRVSPRQHIVARCGSSRETIHVAKNEENPHGTAGLGMSAGVLAEDEREKLEQELVELSANSAQLDAEFEMHPFRQCLYEFEASALKLGLCNSHGARKTSREERSSSDAGRLQGTTLICIKD